MAYFLKDKNEFINEFKEHLQTSDSKKMSLLHKKNYLTILEIMKNQIDQILKDYKTLKQNLLKKMKKKENFWKIKEEFIRNMTSKKGENDIKETLASSLVSMPGKISSISSSFPISLQTPFKLVSDITGISKKEKSNAPISVPQPIQEPYNPQEENFYRDSPHTLHLFKEKENKTLDKTKTILFELSDLMTNFSTKVMQHHEITQHSKKYFYFSYK